MSSLSTFVKKVSSSVLSFDFANFVFLESGFCDYDRYVILKKTILDLNAVESVYAESCYEIFMSSYKNRNNNDDITLVFDLPFDGMYLFLDKSNTRVISSLLFRFFV